MYQEWLNMKKRINLGGRLKKRYPGKYFIVCVHTGRFALGDPKIDGQGGHLHASQEFDRKHGDASECKEFHRDFLGVLL